MMNAHSLLARTLCLLGFFVAMPLAAHADVLAQYGFNNNLNLGSSASGVTASGTVTLAGLLATANQTGNTSGTAGYVTNLVNEGSHSIYLPYANMTTNSGGSPNSSIPISGAANVETIVPFNGASPITMGNEYIQFTIGASGVDPMNLSSIAFDAKRTNLNFLGDPVFRLHAALYYDNLADGDGFKHAGSIKILGGVDGSTTVTAWQNDRVFDLSGITELNSIGAAGVTFRLFVYKGTNTGGSTNSSSGLAFDDLKINGTVAAPTPEPATIASLLLGGIALVIAKVSRRNRKS